MKYLRDNGYRTYIVTGGGQDFVRDYPQQVYGIPGTGYRLGLETQYKYNKQGQAILMRKKDLLLNDNGVGKAKDIYLFLGHIRMPRSATLPAISRCWNTPRGEAARRWRCWCCTTMPSASMLMARPKACLIPRSASSRRLYTTRQRQGMDRDQHEERLEANFRLGKMRPSNPLIKAGSAGGYLRSQGQRRAPNRDKRIYRRVKPLQGSSHSRR